MTINEYQKLALRTNPVKDNKSIQGIIHGVMGLNREVYIAERMISNEAHTTLL